jgi:hypothetical protein
MDNNFPANSVQGATSGGGIRKVPYLQQPCFIHMSSSSQRQQPVLFHQGTSFGSIGRQQAAMMQHHYFVPVN